MQIETSEAMLNKEGWSLSDGDIKIWMRMRWIKRNELCFTFHVKVLSIEFLYDLKRAMQGRRERAPPEYDLFIENPMIELGTNWLDSKKLEIKCSINLSHSWAETADYRAKSRTAAHRIPEWSPTSVLTVPTPS